MATPAGTVRVWIATLPAGGRDRANTVARAAAMAGRHGWATGADARLDARHDQEEHWLDVPVADAALLVAALCAAGLPPDMSATVLADEADPAVARQLDLLREAGLEL